MPPFPWKIGLQCFVSENRRCTLIWGGGAKSVDVDVRLRACAEEQHTCRGLLRDLGGVGAYRAFLTSAYFDSIHADACHMCIALHCVGDVIYSTLIYLWPIKIPKYSRQNSSSVSSTQGIF